MPRNLVVPARVNVEELAHCLLYLQSKGIHPNSKSGLVGDIVQFFSSQIQGLPRPETPKEALIFLANSGLGVKSATREELLSKDHEDFLLEIQDDNDTDFLDNL